MINVILEQGELKYTKTYRIESGVPAVKFAHEVKDFHSTLQDGYFTMTIQKAIEEKTLRQNNYIHFLIWCFAYKRNISQFSAKLACKEIGGFYKTAENPIRGGTSIVYRSFGDRDLKKDELSDVINSFYEYLTIELLIPIPTPEEWDNMSNEERAKWKAEFKREYD